MRHGLRARLLGAICRTLPREVTFLRVLSSRASDAEIAAVQRQVEHMARDKVPDKSGGKVLQGDDVAATVLAEAAAYDLLVQSLRRRGRRGVVLEGLAREMAFAAPCATILLSRRR